MNKAIFLAVTLSLSFPSLAADPASAIRTATPDQTKPATGKPAADTEKTPAPLVIAGQEESQALLPAGTAAVQATAAPTMADGQPDQATDAQTMTVQDVPPSDLWQRIRTGLELPDVDSETVHNFERFYTSHPAYMAATFERARLYLYHVVQAVDERHMPMEIALLPIIESSYNPQAESPSAASGIWQFLPSTGKVYGLKQNNWYDGRRDVLTATRAALDYLDYLHGMFGDWQLALAAYNCGEGCVARAVAQNRSRGLPTDFGSLNLPDQTRNYVPKLLAVRNIIRAPEAYGIQMGDIPNQPAFKKVTLHFPVEARTAAKLAEMDIDDFLALNPGFRRRVIYAESQNTLLLPPDRVDTFRRNLDEAEAHDIRLHTFQAPKGAVLSRIADHFNVTVQWLNDHNPLATRRGKLVAAQTLVLPPAASKIADASPAQLTRADPHEKKAGVAATASRRAAYPGKKRVASNSRVRIHTVRKGDTLYDLAKHYKVDVAEIVELNGKRKNLRPGERIQIPASG